MNGLKFYSETLKMDSIFSSAGTWLVLAIIFFLIAVAIFYFAHGRNGWYWLFIVLGVLSLLWALVVYTRRTQIKEDMAQGIQTFNNTGRQNFANFRNRGYGGQYGTYRQ